MKKIKWGILSTAKIGIEKVIPAMQQSQNCEIFSIASRDLATAWEAAKQLDIPKAVGTYEELLADDEVEAIYIPLPNHMHVEWAKKCLEAGKHVLCEKPIGLDAKEAEDLLECSKKYPHLKLMEAFMYRLHPQWQKTKELLADGAIGELVTVQSFFSYFNDDPTNIRNIPEIGGGGLMDIGCYTISLSRFVFEAEPDRVMGTLEFDPILKTDIVASGIMQFCERVATWTCGTQMSAHQRVNIVGTTGRIEIEIPFNAPPDKPTRLWLHRDKTEEITFDICDQYTIQGDLFTKAILEDTPVPTPFEDAVANMRVIDAIRESEKAGGWISI